MEWLKVANGINGTVLVQCEHLHTYNSIQAILIGIGLVVGLGTCQNEALNYVKNVILTTGKFFSILDCEIFIEF